MKNDTQYDALVIGSGQGGVPLATTLAAKGVRTAIVEMAEVGGSCINYGCTPTKTMVASARSAHQVARAAEYGIRGMTERHTVDMARIRARKRNIVDMFRSGSESRIENTENLTLIRGAASFVDSHTVTVVGRDGAAPQTIRASKIFINTGTRTNVPDISGLTSVPFLTNETVMELDSVPDHLIIVGGGYIGVEFGQMFRRFGAQVTIVQRADVLLPHEDQDVSSEMARILSSEGIDIIFGAEPESVSRTGAGMMVRIRQEKEVRDIDGTHLLLAAGRVPNTDLLNPGAAGIGVDGRGYIQVNERLETGAEGIWALGDVKGGPAFTHISYDDYRIIMRNLYGDGMGSIAGRMVPYTVFTDPQLGRIGPTEKAARASGKGIRVAKIPMDRVARALEVDETQGFMKALVDSSSDRILGFAMIGMEAGEVAGAVQLAMMGGLPYTALRDGTFAHPTLIESLNNLFSALD